jgi:hypothetical protein
MVKIALLIFTIFIVNGCIEKKTRNLESPCVAIEFDSISEIEANDNPCIRRPANKWLL